MDEDRIHNRHIFLYVRVCVFLVAVTFIKMVSMTVFHYVRWFYPLSIFYHTDCARPDPAKLCDGQFDRLSQNRALPVQLSC
jgi:hypothetical protein